MEAVDRLFLKGIAVQSRRSNDRCRTLFGLWNRYRQVVSEASNSSKILRIVDSLFERPAITIGQAKELVDVSTRGATLMVERLQSLGILAEVTGRATNRIFMALELIAIAEEPESDQES